MQTTEPLIGAILYQVQTSLLQTGLRTDFPLQSWAEIGQCRSNGIPGKNTWGYACSRDAYVVLGFDPYSPSQDLIGPVPQNSHYQWGSSHPGGINAVFADGSVHVIPYTITSEMMLYLCVRDDGHVVNVD